MCAHFQKRNYFRQQVSEDKRIGNDMLLLDEGNFWVTDDEPFIADATTAFFFTKGSADVSINMTDYHITAPCMVVFFEGSVIRQGEISEGARMDVIVISKQFTDNILSDSNTYGPLRSQITRDPVFPLKGQNKVVIAFNYLLWNVVQMTDSPFRLEAARHMTLTLFYGFALSNPARLNEKVLASRSETITSRFYELVKEHYRNERTVAFYADKLCITPKYLSRAVREATGKPALELIDDYVIAESKALLRSTDMTVDQISAAMGFMNQSLFGKYFKRVTGSSPRSYRIEFR